jgi:Holliday junction resolvase-like predicted endonuclease
MDQPVIIIKASGAREPFDESKLRRSLQASGADPGATEKVLSYIKSELKPDMTTAEIYQRAFEILKADKPHIAARYSLRRAMMELGPSGHPFEKFVGAVLHSEGYKTEVNKIIQGICVTHEVDVVAEKDGRRAMIELKYHNTLGMKTDIKIALYIQARFEDIDKSWQREKEPSAKLHEAWLMTNTKLTADAIAYANCVGMKAIGWNYPEQGNLRQLIERSRLHPISALTSLSRSEKEKLLDKGLVLCRDVRANKDTLSSIGVGKDQLDQIITEADNLCGSE